MVLSEDEIIELDAEEMDEEKIDRGKEFRKNAKKQVSFKDVPKKGNSDSGTAISKNT
jgi:hypothetical protein